MDLRGKTALITGAARGIGQNTAQELANAGVDILGVDLNADDLQKTAQIVEEAGRMFWPFACDVSDEAAVRQMVSQAELGRELERLKDHTVINRFSIEHMAFLTGWTQNYLRILERRKQIPKAFRRDDAQKTRYWDDEGARSVLHFKRSQDKRFHRLNGN